MADFTLRCVGAAGQVTGSGYLLETPTARILIDFGLFAGEADAEIRNRDLGFVDPRTIDAVLVTHAHVDHSGRLPLLARHGLAAPIYATAATIDIAAILLEDSARLAASDAQRTRGEEGREPLYDLADVVRTISLVKRAALGARTPIAPGVTATFVEAGHILGSASIIIELQRGDATETLVFSGDIGPRGMPILRDASPPAHADLVVIETTYGDRDHPPLESAYETFTDLLRRAIWEQRQVIVPAFAVGRTQLLLYLIARGVREGRLPAFPIYLDSPMAASVSEVYARHRQLYDDEAGELARSQQLERDLRTVRVVETVAESKELSESRQSCVIMAGSGMCEGGRVVHHLRHRLGQTTTTVLLTGFMAEGTLGRALKDGAREVQVLGDDVVVRAEILTLNGLSAHAGQSDLLTWLEPMLARRPNTALPRPRVILTHGEEPQREAFARCVAERFGVTAERPQIGERL